MSVALVRLTMRAAERVRVKLEALPENKDGFELDMRVLLDAPECLGKEIDRLRRLVRKHGGRP